MNIPVGKKETYRFTSYFNEIGGFQFGNTWKLEPLIKMITLTHLDDIVTFNLQCAPGVSNSWSIDTEISIKITNIYGTTIEKQISFCFDSECDTINTGKIASMAHISRHRWDHDPEEFQCVLIIRVKKCSGIEHMELSDFSIPKNIDSEIEVSVGGYKLYVDKLPLLCFSSVLRGMLSNTDEIEIKYTKVEDFIVFLRLLCGEKQHLMKENIEGILKLADAYDVPFLMADCEDYLISQDSILIGTKLYIAVKYSFAKLQQAVILRELAEAAQALEFAMAEARAQVEFLGQHEHWHCVCDQLEQPQGGMMLSLLQYQIFQQQQLFLQQHLFNRQH